MTKTEMQKIFRRHKRLGIRPWSFYQVAEMLHVNRATISQVVNRKYRSRPMMLKIESLLSANLDG